MTMDLREEVARLKDEFPQFSEGEHNYPILYGRDEIVAALDRLADAALSVIQARAKGQPGVDGLEDDAFDCHCGTCRLAREDEASRERARTLAAGPTLLSEAAEFVDLHSAMMQIPGPPSPHYFACTTCHGIGNTRADITHTADCLVTRLREAALSTPSNPGGWQDMESAPEGLPSEFERTVQRIIDISLRTYDSRAERVALRCALGDAAGICDAFARKIQDDHRTPKTRRITKRGTELGQIAGLCGNAIWDAREKVGFEAPPTVTKEGGQ